LKKYNQYDFIASYYDNLAGLVFGQCLFNAQLLFFSKIPLNANVLILGGGTGWFLPQLFKINATIQVWYVDISEKMISMARKVDVPQQNIQFICGTQENIPQDVFFDVIILPFFVDGFLLSPLKDVLCKIKTNTSKNSIWIVTDFYKPQRNIDKWKLWLTYKFFGKIVNNPNKKPVPWWNAFDELDFKTLEEVTLNYQLIKSTIYTCNEY